MRSETKQASPWKTTRDVPLAVHELHLDCREERHLRFRSSVVFLAKLSLQLTSDRLLSLTAFLLKVPYASPATITLPPYNTTYVCSDVKGC